MSLAGGHGWYEMFHAVLVLDLWYTTLVKQVSRSVVSGAFGVYALTAISRDVPLYRP